MVKYGYIRVNTNKTKFKGTSLDEQINLLVNAGCTIIYKDISDNDNAPQPELERLLNEIEEGDDITVTFLDRFTTDSFTGFEVMDTIYENKATISIVGMPKMKNSEHKLMLRMWFSFIGFQTDLEKEAENKQPVVLTKDISKVTFIEPVTTEN